MSVRPILALIAAICLTSGCASGASYAMGVPGETMEVARAGALDDGGFLSFGAVSGPMASMDPAAFAASRMVVRNAVMNVEVAVVEDEKGKPDKKATGKKVESAAKAAAAIGKGLKGWVVFESQNRVVLRVPAESLDAAIEQVSALGDVTHQTVQGSDVTDQHRDNQIRLDNLEKSRQRYLKLLEAAEDVKAALAVEKELQRVTLEIERLKGKQKSLETSVRFSLLTVNFSGAYPEKTGPMPGPLGWVFYGLWWFVKWLFIWE